MPKTETANFCLLNALIRAIAARLASARKRTMLSIGHDGGLWDKAVVAGGTFKHPRLVKAEARR